MAAQDTATVEAGNPPVPAGFFWKPGVTYATLPYMKDRPKRKPANTASVDAFFRSVYDSLSRRVLEEVAADEPGVHADAQSERIEAATTPMARAPVSKRRPRSSR